MTRALLLLALSSCLGPRTPAAPRVAIPEAVETPAGAEEPRPRPAFLIVPKPETLSAAESLLPVKTTNGAQRTIYMNLHGGTYSHGPDNSAENRSSVTPKHKTAVTIPAYEKNDKSRLELLACTKAAFARWNVAVTTDDPGQAPHVEVVVGGPPSLLDLAKNVGGVAPMYGDCDMVERAVVFVFSKIYKDARDECETVAHEVGHAMGLDHEFLCADPMTYLEGCGQKVFQDTEAKCGESGARACMCGPTQNSVKFLDARLGKAEGAPPIALPPITPVPIPNTPPPPPPPPTSGDKEPPRIALIAPPAAAKLGEGGTVTLGAHVTDDAKVARVLLLWTISGKTTELDCASPPKGVRCSTFFGVYTFDVPGGKGPRSWAIKAIDGAGNERVSEPRALMLGDGTSDPPDVPAPPAASAPTLSFKSPDNGAIVHFGGVIPVRVTVIGAVSAVQIVWRTHGSDEIIGLTKLDATTYGADLAVPALTIPGPRTLRVRVPGGNATVPPDRVITILP